MTCPNEIGFGCPVGNQRDGFVSPCFPEEALYSGDREVIWRIRGLTRRFVRSRRFRSDVTMDSHVGEAGGFNLDTIWYEVWIRGFNERDHENVLLCDTGHNGFCRGDERVGRDWRR